MTAQEMMLPWFGVVVDGDAQPEAIASYRPGDFDGPLRARPALLRVTTPPVTVTAQ